MNDKQYYKNILNKYDLNKLSTKGAELLDIACKYQFYSSRTDAIYLKLLYKIAYFIAMFIAIHENKNALIK